MEPLSAAAGVIGFVTAAVELAATIEKLIQLCRDIKDAVPHFTSLVKDLEIFSEALKECEAANVKNHNSLTRRALEDCTEQLFKLQHTFQKLSPNLASRSLIKKNLAAAKLVAKRLEIKRMRESLDRVKSTLQFVKEDSFQRLVVSQLEIHHQLLLDIPEVVSNASQGRRAGTKLVECRRFPANESEPLLERRHSFPQHWTTPVPNDQALVERTFSRIRTLRSDSKVEYATTLARIQISRSTSTLYTCRFSGNQKSEEEETTYVIFPARFLRIFGVSRGLRIHAWRTDSWQYSLQPFNAVPENAVVFDFCRDGNLKALRTLLQRGEASIRDTDPLGRTPLFVAINALQPETTEFLLQHGAHNFVSAWSKCLRPSFYEIEWYVESEVNPKLNMMKLLQRYAADAYTQTTVTSLTGRMLLYFRKNKSFPKPLTTQRSPSSMALQLTATLFSLFPADDLIARSRVIDFLVYKDYHQEVLYWWLRNLPGPLYESSDGSSDEKIHILLQAVEARLPISNPSCMRLIVQKTPNIHRLYEYTDTITAPFAFSTATSLATRQSDLFFAWRDILIKLGYNISDFISAELEMDASPLGQGGWDNESLSALFGSDIWYNEKSPGIDWSECGRCKNMQTSKAIVDLRWRRHLRSLRTKSPHDICCGLRPTTQSECPPESVIDSDRTENSADNYREIQLVTDQWPMETRAFPGQSKANDDEGGWLYQPVCLQSCLDGVCASNVFENSATDNPPLPPFVSQQRGNETSIEALSAQLVEIKGDNDALGKDLQWIRSISWSKLIWYILVGVSLLGLIYRLWVRMSKTA